MIKKSIFSLTIQILLVQWCIAAMVPSEARAQAFGNDVQTGDAEVVADTPQGRFGKARQRWKDMTPEQREQYRAKMNRWKDLEPQRKKKIRDRFEQYQKLQPEKQEIIKRNWKKYRHLNERQQGEIKEKYQRWIDMPPEKKQMIREMRERFKSLPPEEQQRIRERRKKWRTLGEGQKRQIREKHKERYERLKDLSPQQRKDIWEEMPQKPHSGLERQKRQQKPKGSPYR